MYSKWKGLADDMSMSKNQFVITEMKENEPVVHFQHFHLCIHQERQISKEKCVASLNWMDKYMEIMCLPYVPLLQTAEYVKVHHKKLTG